MRNLQLVLVFAAAIAGCAEKEPIAAGVRPPKNLPKPFVFEFRTVAIQVDGRAINLYEDGHMTCGDFEATKVCSNLGHEFISFELTNRSSHSVAILWPGARWVDEFGRPHSVARFPGDKHASDVLVQPGEVHRLTPFPSEKTYLVPDRENAYYFTEPIVPWDLRSGDPDEKRRDMMESRTSTFLVVPIIFSNRTYSIKFEFQVFPFEKAQVVG